MWTHVRVPGVCGELELWKGARTLPNVQDPQRENHEDLPLKEGIPPSPGELKDKMTTNVTTP